MEGYATSKQAVIDIAQMYLMIAQRCSRYMI